MAFANPYYKQKPQINIYNNYLHCALCVWMNQKLGKN